MAEEKKDATKEYVVVFDQLGVHTGEFVNNGPGMQQLALTKIAVRGDVVHLNAEDAERHLESGAVIAKSDKRAKQVKANTQLAGGVRRDVEVSLAPVALEQTEPAVAGGEGAKRAPAGSLGSKAELQKLNVTELKQLAADHGITVERGDTKPKLAAKLAKVDTGTAAGDGGADEPGANPGQKDDESPPPVAQPDTPPDE
jgi:hypothetical protein